jgi:hypothetical protein
MRLELYSAGYISRSRALRLFVTLSETTVGSRLAVRCLTIGLHDALWNLPSRVRTARCLTLNSNGENYNVSSENNLAGPAQADTTARIDTHLWSLSHICAIYSSFYRHPRPKAMGQMGFSHPERLVNYIFRAPLPVFSSAFGSYSSASSSRSLKDDTNLTFSNALLPRPVQVSFFKPQSCMGYSVRYFHPHPYHHRAPFPTYSLSPTRVNNAHDTERPSLKLRFPSGASNILNSSVVNAARQSLYSISSSFKRTTLTSCSDNVEIATVQWDRSSPRMVFRRKKWKRRNWPSRTAPKNDSVHVFR